MRDENIQTPAGLTPAEAAVNHLLQRIQRDADLSWLMMGTEAFARLCAAEAGRTGETIETVTSRYQCRSADRPRLLVARELVERLTPAASTVVDLIEEMGDYTISPRVNRAVCLLREALTAAEDVQL